MGFTELKGQKRAIEVLQAGVSTGRISHAYLFYGIDGIGKNKAAILFAQLLNCLEERENKPCGQCVSCRKISGGNHPDVLKIVPDGASLKIAQMRTLQEKAFFKCYEGQFKVIIIDDAHLMTVEAANSVLKFLEEPPPVTIILLLAEDTNTLPFTILSRCQPVPFNILDEGVIKEILLEQGVKTNIPLSLAEGSVGKALRLHNSLDTQQLLSNAEKMLDNLKEAGYREIFGWVDSLEKDRDTTEVTLEFMASLYRQRLLSLVSNNADENEIKKGIAVLAEINKVPFYVKYNVNLRLLLEVLFMKVRNIELGERGINPIG